MFHGMNNTRLERKILIILDFENGFFLPIYHSGLKWKIKIAKSRPHNASEGKNPDLFSKIVCVNRRAVKIKLVLVCVTVCFIIIYENFISRWRS